VDAMLNKESVTGVEQRVGAVNKVGLEMDVMVPLGDLAVVVINVYLNLVCIACYSIGTMISDYV
jgi:hypothetical protein